MLILLAGMLALFVGERLPTELTAMSAFALLLAIGLLPPDKAMAVFANPGPIAVGAMFILSAALDRCGAIDILAGGLNRMPVLPLRVVLPLLILLVALISGFINNTPVVVVFLPVVLHLAKRIGVPSSKLLIPLSYASIFGGTCTLVGTSTNIIISSMAEDSGFEPLSMFELAAVGLPLVFIGTLYLTILGPRLLPVRETITSILTEEERREYIVEAFIQNGSKLADQPLGETSLGKVRRLRVLEILRHGVKLSTVDPTTILKVGDRLLLAMSPHAVSSAQAASGLDLRDVLGEGLEQISLSEGMMVEAILGPDSHLIGSTLSESNFRQHYRMAPVAIHRGGRNIRRDFHRVPLEHGDTLLLLGTPEAIENLRSNEDLIILEKPPVVLASRKKKIPLILAVIGGVIATATLGWLPIASAAIIGCVILLLTRCLTTRDAFESIHWPILFLIFAMLGVGAAMEETGASLWLANQMVSGVGIIFPEPWQPLALLAGVYLLTAIMTEVLSNNAAAVLVATVAIGLAQSMGLDARPFLIAIAIAASASFSTPIGYQTNTYVYGVGGYRFTDFAKIGIPLNLLAFTISIFVIPRIWPFE